jgi:hypothetical protein
MRSGKRAQFGEHRQMPDLVAQNRPQMRPRQHLDSLQRIADHAKCCLDFGQQFFQRSDADLMEEILLAGDVIVKRSLANTRGGRDFTRGRYGVAAFAEQFRRYVEKPL